MTLTTLFLVLLGLMVFVFICGKVAGRLEARDRQRKHWAQRVRLRITPWHLGQMSDVFLRPNEARHLAEHLIDHLLSEKDEYAS